METRRILADTGPLYALSDPSDRHHRRAHEELAELCSLGMEVVVAYPTVAEGYTLVMRFLGLQTSRKWLHSLVSRGGLINPAPDDYTAAADIIAQFPDQSITLFDALLAVLGRRLGMAVWTFDSDFDVMKIPVWRQ